MKTDQKKISSILSLLTSAIIIGLSYVVLKAGLKYASPFTVLIDRLAVAVFVIFLLKKTGVIVIDRININQKIKLFFLSMIYPIAFFLFQNLGIKNITTSETSIIYSLIPILTTIISAVVLKEKTTKLQKFGILLSFSGMAYISFQSFNGFSDNSKGYLMIFCSLLSMVFYYVFLKESVAKISPITITYYLILFAGLSSIVIYLSWNFIKFHTLPDLLRYENNNYILTILYLGILSTLGTSLLTSIGIKNLSTVQTSIFNNISPFFGILAGVTIMGDVLRTYQIIGAVFIFTGTFISLKYSIKNKIT